MAMETQNPTIRGLRVAQPAPTTLQDPEQDGHGRLERLELPRLLRASEVAWYCGISRSQAYRWMESGVIPTVRIGGAVRADRLRLDQWIDRLSSGEETG